MTEKAIIHLQDAIPVSHLACRRVYKELQVRTWNSILPKSPKSQTDHHPSTPPNPPSLTHPPTMPYSPVLVVTFWILVKKTITNEDDMAKFVRTFDGYSDFQRQDLIPLWHDLRRDLPEWLRVVGDYEQADAMVLDVLSVVAGERPRIPTFPRKLQPGAPCSEAEVEEVRLWDMVELESLIPLVKDSSFVK